LPTTDAHVDKTNFKIVVLLTFGEEIKLSLASDKFGQSILTALAQKHHRHPKVSLAEYELKEGLLIINGLIYILSNKRL
jgi:hypothetical protein